MERLLLAFVSLTIVLFAQNIVLDGELDEWDPMDRITVPNDKPPIVPLPNEIYARYVERPYPAIAFAIRSQVAIGPNTTLWIDADNDPRSGYKIWGLYLGAEYFININANGKPYLYSTTDFYNYLQPLEYCYSPDHKSMELLLPLSSIHIGDLINLFADINNEIFLPADYAQGPFPYLLIKKWPTRKNSAKRVAIVFSESTKRNFYDANLTVQKAYNQLFMAMQYHAMMAGVPYDMLTEEDLKDLSKLVQYDAIIFPYMANVRRTDLPYIQYNLLQAIYRYHIGVITAGDFLTNYADDSEIEGDSYRYMKKILGLKRIDGAGPVKLRLIASADPNPITKGYEPYQKIIEYPNANRWYNYFAPVMPQSDRFRSSVAAYEIVNDDDSHPFEALWTLQIDGSKIVHFAELEFIGDTNLLWRAIDWCVYGDNPPVQLHMGRYANLFATRVDMDQAQEIDEVRMVDGALLDILKDWKRRYNYVASCYIDIGANPPDQRTDWSYSAPLYQAYVALGNEIGTHSMTHPHNTNELSDAQIEFEFKESMDRILEHLPYTWRETRIRGGAVPGMPESTQTAHKILKYLDYLSGGYSSIGAGYPGAFGHLTPQDSKFYFSPNMSFDFTLIDFGIPVYEPDKKKWDHVPLTPEEAKEYWKKEYRRIMDHASLPIVHWPWHDYGPTTMITQEHKYSLDMFTSLIELAKNDDSEFLTTADLNYRMKAFEKANLKVNYTDEDSVDVDVDIENGGKFAISIPDRTIGSVNGWYAYDEHKVFLPKDGGSFHISFTPPSDRPTHIYKLPKRAELVSLEGNGLDLKAKFKGEGSCSIYLKDPYYFYIIIGPRSIEFIDKHHIKVTYPRYGTHRLKLISIRSYLEKLFKKLKIRL